MLLITVLFLIQLSMVFSGVSSCTERWFGSRCDYMCHCENKQCLSDGQCKDGSKCEAGWFGPSCQYEDIGRIGLTQNYQYILDDDEETCLTETDGLVWESYDHQLFHFLWLRLILGKLEHTNTFEVSFESPWHYTKIPCKQQRHFYVNNRTIDIYCTVDMPVNYVKIKFDVDQDVCSLHISGGRNVALKQKTYQTSNWTEHGMVHHSGLAVDGNENNTLEGGSCSHTNVGDDYPLWSVQLQYPATVNRYDLYNRKRFEKASDRLYYFILESLNSDNKAVLEYHDREQEPQLIYSVVPDSLTRDVSNVTIKVVIQKETLIELCEVKVFGETDCPVGKYGFECQETCDCPVKCETSYNRSFGCPLCSAGYQGWMCDNDGLSPTLQTPDGLQTTCNCPLKCDASSEASVECHTNNQSSHCDAEVNVPIPSNKRTDLVMVISFLSFIILGLVVVNIWQYQRQRRTVHRKTVFTIENDHDNDNDMKASLI